MKPPWSSSGRHRAHVEFTDWSSGPAAHVVLSCGHEFDFRPPSPAKGDLITCAKCRTAASVVRPIRRLDRHAEPLTAEDLVPARGSTSLLVRVVTS